MSSEAKQKRFEGEVQKWLGKFGFINYEDSGIRKRIYFSSHTTRPDWRGSRAWVSAGIPVTFVRTKRHDDKTGEFCDCATDVAAAFPMSEPQDLSQYRETSVVYKKEFAFVFLQRECGDVTFLHRTDVLPQYEFRWDLLKPGVPVFHGVRFHEEKKLWKACDAELYSEEELYEFFNPSPVEPEASILQPELEPELETVLAPATRSVPLLQLILERRGKS
jgi:hypothetical protein